MRTSLRRDFFLKPTLLFKFAKCVNVSLAIDGKGQTVTRTLDGDHLLLRYASLVQLNAHVIRHEIVRVAVDEDDGHARLLHRLHGRGFFNVKAAVQASTQADKRLDREKRQFQILDDLLDDLLCGGIATIGHDADNVFR